MVKNILVSVGDRPHERNALNYAAHLAVLLGAHHLSCVFFQDLGSRDDRPGAQTIAQNIEAYVDAEYGQYDFLNYHVETLIGKRPQMIVQKARSADLTVIGVSESIKMDGLRLIYEEIDDILLNITAKPTIVVHERCTLLRRILVVHHSDPASDRVLQLSAELAEQAKASILALAIAETQPEASRIGQQMQDYLQYRDVQVELETQRGFTVANILETASARDCDLIALGASQHGKLYEMIFQTTTESVVKLADRAVMVVH